LYTPKTTGNYFDATHPFAPDLGSKVV